MAGTLRLPVSALVRAEIAKLPPFPPRAAHPGAVFYFPSQDAVFRKHVADAPSLRQFLAHTVLPAHLFQGAGKRLLGKRLRHDHHAVDVAEDKVAWLHHTVTDADRLA